MSRCKRCGNSYADESQLEHTCSFEPEDAAPAPKGIPQWMTSAAMEIRSWIWRSTGSWVSPSAIEELIQVSFMMEQEPGSQAEKGGDHEQQQNKATIGAATPTQSAGQVAPGQPSGTETQSPTPKRNENSGEALAGARVAGACEYLPKDYDPPDPELPEPVAQPWDAYMREHGQEEYAIQAAAEHVGAEPATQKTNQDWYLEYQRVVARNVELMKEIAAADKFAGECNQRKIEAIGRNRELLGELERARITIGNALRNAVRVLQRLLDGGVSCKSGLYAAKNECEGSIKTALSLAAVALGDDAPEPSHINKPLTDLSDKELCQQFASAYRIHSNPGIYNDLKAGHDEILRRLSRLAEAEKALRNFVFKATKRGWMVAQDEECRDIVKRARAALGPSSGEETGK